MPIDERGTIMKVKFTAVIYATFLSLILLSALHYIYLGQWKAYVALFGIVELLVVLTAAILFIFKKTRIKTQKYVYILLGIMQFFPMGMAFELSGQYIIYGIFHVLMAIVCASMILNISRKRNDSPTIC